MDTNPIIVKQCNAFEIPLAFGPSDLHHDEIGPLVHFPLDSSAMLFFSFAQSSLEHSREQQTEVLTSNSMTFFKSLISLLPSNRIFFSVLSFRVAYLQTTSNLSFAYILAVTLMICPIIFRTHPRAVKNSLTLGAFKDILQVTYLSATDADYFLWCVIFQIVI